MEEISIRQREIVLLPFPFSDHSGWKIRPALVLSNNDFNRTDKDIIVCAITSNLSKKPYSIALSQRHIEGGSLENTCMIKTKSIFTIDKSLVLKNIATVNSSLFDTVIYSIAHVLSQKKARAES